MNTTKRRFLLGLLKGFNLAVMGLSAIAVTIVLFSDVRRDVSLSDFLSMRVTLGNFAIAAMTLVAWHIVFTLFGFYQSTRLVKLRAVVADTVKGTTLAAACLAAAAQLFRIRMATPRFLVLFWV